MKLLRYILFPFSVLYGIVVRIRHWLYDLGIFSSQRYDFPVICIGNISVGGTGKTPMTEYLIRLLLPNYEVAVLSRGYKRKTKGFVLADEQSTSLTLGDEPFQYHRKFPNLYVAVDEQRVRGMASLLEKNTDIQVVLLDDAFQHRAIEAGFSILLTSYTDLYTDDFLLPTGSLRDIVSRVSAADIIIVTKCPSTLSISEKKCIIQKIRPKHQAVYFAGIQYADKVFSATQSYDLFHWIQEPFTLVVGIANPKPLTDFLTNLGANYKLLSFADHHHFSEHEIGLLRQESRILTTEKDYVRLYEALPSVFYLPIETYFIFDKEKKEFDQKILNFVKSN